MSDHILLVLGIVEGKRFPKRPHHQILVEANFDGEILNTDVIKHSDSPKFNTELAWEIDKKSLHQHRLQRTPIKIQVFAVESTSTRKESIGYCILDLRTAQQTSVNKKPSWHLLLRSKYQHMKPEIKTVLSIEEDQVKLNEQKKDLTQLGNSPSVAIDENNNLDVVLDSEQGYYLIGTETPGCKIFVLSVSVGGARNLVKVLPSDTKLKSEDGFYLYYSLFDNDVTNETFYDIMRPTMPTERASVRIYTTQPRLETYLRKKKTLEIYLCSTENTLGQATIALEPLLNKSVELPRSVEGLFALKTSANENLTTSDEDAMIGVSITLRKESDEPPAVSPVLAPNVVQTARNKSNEENEEKARSPPLNVTPPQKKIDRKFQKSTPEKFVSKQEKNHHFLYSIDIRSVSNLDIHSPLHCICRYTYPFFGSSSPIITNPPVYIQRNSEVLLPQSFCKFEFASTIQLLQSTLSRVPLIIEVWKKDQNVKDELLGIAQLRLSNVFEPDNKESTGPFVKSERIVIVSANNLGQRVGNLHVVLGFEDKGEIKTALQARHEQSFSSSTLTTEPLTEETKPPRSTQEYQVAMALEMWRQQQEEHFKATLASKENDRMKTLANEWKQRDIEREMLLKRKLDEYNMLEAKLKNTLADLEAREKQVSEQEIKLNRSEKLLAEEYERKTIEMREASRRLKEEYQHQLHLERIRYADLEEKYNRSTKQIHDAENKLQNRENEIYALKDSMLNRPEIKLQSEMNLLLVEKNELERRVESINKSKIHYKQQWGRALRELARIKVNEQEAAKMRLKRQQQELDHMKLRYRAVEEKEVMKTEKEELNDVKEEINKRLEELQIAAKQTPNFKQQQEPQQETNDPTEESSETIFHKSRIAKLIEERDMLLQTGVYAMDDRVIVEIEREIQQAIAQDGA